MTEIDMSQSDQLRIDQLLSAIVDDGPSRELITELDELLRDKPDLQDHYARMMQLVMHLQYEFDSSIQRAAPLVPRVRRPLLKVTDELRDLRDAAREEQCGNYAPPKMKFLRWPSWGASRAWKTAIAAILVAATGIAIWQWNFASERALREANNLPFHAGMNGTAQDGLNDSLLIQDSYALRMLSRLTNTALPSSVSLPRSRLTPAHELTLCSGTVWIQRTPQSVERGYLLALGPKQAMEIFVDTEAGTQNSLSIIELGALGLVSGQAVTFNNLVGNDVHGPARRTGYIGEFSNVNNTTTSKFFLLAGSHIPDSKSHTTTWHQSDYVVALDGDDCKVIGWDDSGYAEMPGPNLNCDKDFNDIRAVVRFNHLDGEIPRESSGKITYSPAPAAAGSMTNVPVRNGRNPAGYQLVVPPNQELLLMISSQDREANLIQIVDPDSQQAIWQVPTTQVSSKWLGSGIYRVHNHSPQRRQYEVQVLHSRKCEHDEVEWHNIAHKIFAEDAETSTIGFSLTEQDSWTDVHLHARWFSNKPVGLPTTNAR